MMARNRTYYALTTLNKWLLGWRIAGIGATAAEAEREALATLPPLCEDNFAAQADHRNLRVVSRTAARRQYGINDRSVEAYYEADAERFFGDHQEA